MRDLDEIERPPELSDGRVRLRRVLEKDRAAVVRALNDPVAARFLTRPPYPYQDEHFDEWLALANDRRGLHETHTAHWSIADAGDDFYLGGASLEIDAEREAGEIGYQVAPWARGRGVATAAARLIRDWAFDTLELARLEIATDVDNIASQRTAQAAGLSYEGLARGYLEGRVFAKSRGDGGGVSGAGDPSAPGDGWTVRRERRDHALFGMLRDDPRAPAAPVPWPCLDDGHVVVRAFEPDDAGAVAQACDDPEIAHWIFRLPAPYTRADAERFVAGARRTLVTGEQIRLAVADAAGGELLGSVSLEPSWQLGLAEVGYWVKREARRRGVATAAARLVIRWAFEELGLERLELQTYPGNIASQSLAESLGFRREGLLRGVLPGEPGKDRRGRVATGSDAVRGRADADGSWEPAATKARTPPGGLTPPRSLPPRDDQVLFGLLKHEWLGARPD